MSVPRTSSGSLANLKSKACGQPTLLKGERKEVCCHSRIGWKNWAACTPPMRASHWRDPSVEFCSQGFVDWNTQRSNFLWFLFTPFLTTLNCMIVLITRTRGRTQKASCMYRPNPLSYQNRPCRYNKNPTVFVHTAASHPAHGSIVQHFSGIELVDDTGESCSLHSGACSLLFPTRT